MSRIYYRGARAAVVCYGKGGKGKEPAVPVPAGGVVGADPDRSPPDLTDSSSFQRAKFWVNELQNCEEVRGTAGGRGTVGDTEPYRRGRGAGGERVPPAPLPAAGLPDLPVRHQERPAGGGPEEEGGRLPRRAGLRRRYGAAGVGGSSLRGGAPAPPGTCPRARHVLTWGQRGREHGAPPVRCHQLCLTGDFGGAEPAGARVPQALTRTRPSFQRSRLISSRPPVRRVRA